MIASLLKKLRSPFVLLPALTLGLIFSWNVYATAPRKFDIPNNNLLTNGSFENEATGWEVDHSGVLQYRTLSTKGLINNYGLRTEISSYTDGRLTIATPEVELQPGKAYIFKAYYKTDTALDLYIRTKNSSGSYEYQQYKHLPDYDYPLSTMSFIFEAPTEGRIVSVVISYGSVGSVELDSAYIIESNAPSVGGDTATNILSDATWQFFKSGELSAVDTTVDVPRVAQVASYGSGSTGFKTEASYPIIPHTLYSVAVTYESTGKVDIGMDVTLQQEQYRYVVAATLQSTPGKTRQIISFEVPNDAVSVRPTVQFASVGKVTLHSLSMQKIKDAAQFDKPRVSITFDDGWESSYINGAKIIEEHGFLGTFYINPSSINKQSFMNSDAITALISKGHQIGSHGNEHIDMTAFTASLIDNDLSRSANYLSKLGIEKIDFASPYGKYDPLLAPMSEKYFRSHRGTESGVNTKQNLELQNIKALFVRKETTDETLKEMLQMARESNGWLVLIYHEIEASESPFAIDKAVFERHMKIVSEASVEVQTVGQAIDQISPQM